MKPLKQFISTFLIVSLITGCAASSTRLIEDGNSLSDTRFCRNYLNDYRDLWQKEREQNISSKEVDYLIALRDQKERRSLTRAKCEELVKDQNTTAVAIGVLVVMAAALANSGGGGAPSSGGYAWDQFYDGNGNLIWRCRNKANGQFAYNSRCATAYKVDSTWPAK